MRTAAADPGEADGSAIGHFGREAMTFADYWGVKEDLGNPSWVRHPDRWLLGAELSRRA